MEAYKVCKERIDAVELALKDALTGTGIESAPQPAKAVSKARQADADPVEADDDIPF